jgi:putative Mg2+ transporter-C (MgtC) family protein
MSELGDLLVIDWTAGAHVTTEEAGLRIVLAIVLSALLGIDRELKNKPLGLRTNLLVSLGAASFSLMALQLVDTFHEGPPAIQIDPGRAMEAIVGAIGFLGAAAIIQGRFELFGATTGASIWAVGAIGMAAGFGFYALAFVITGVAVFVLTILGFATGRAGKPEDADPPTERDRSPARGQ